MESGYRPSPPPGRNVPISGEYTATCHPPSSAQPPRLIIRPDDPSPSIPVGHEFRPENGHSGRETAELVPKWRRSEGACRLVRDNTWQPVLHINAIAVHLVSAHYGGAIVGS